MSETQSETNRFSGLHRRLWWAGVAGLVAALVSYWWFFSASPSPRPEEFVTERCMLPQPAVTEFAVKSSAEGGDQVGDDDLVLGVVVEEAARAYPLAMLNAAPRTKVLNDVLGGKPIVVTWCDRCQTGTVYERAVAGQTFTFSVFGSLWRDSLVMEDQESKTQWSQWEGSAKRGALKGATLDRLPCEITTWRSWRTQYPMGDVVALDNREPEFAQDRYRDAKNFVLAVGQGSDAKAWNLAELRESGVVNDVWQGRPVAAVYVEASGTARLFERRLDGKTLTLRRLEGVWRDNDSGTAWNMATGTAIDGALHGRRLMPLASWVTTKRVWRLFHSRE